MLRSIAACTLAALAFHASADILRVDVDNPSPADGSSWGRAFDSLTDALAASSSGDQIWVAGGTYSPELPAGRDATFTIPSGVAVYGGFDGNESSLAQRGNPLSPATTLNGAGLQSYHVVSFINANTNTILDGFFITKGFANGAGSGRENGGGIFANGSSPTLANLDIRSCLATEEGAGVYLGGVAGNGASIINCTIENNAGIGLTSNVDILVVDCFIQDNNGAGIVLRGPGLSIITGCSVVSNVSDIGAGGVLVDMPNPSSKTFFTDCEFRDNTGELAGGVAYLDRGDHEIHECRFFKNTASELAGAIYFNCDNSSDSLLLENSLLTGNISDGGGVGAVAGAVVVNSPGNVHIANCTVAKNTTVQGLTGGVLSGLGTTRIDNSILWSNDSLATTGQNDNIRIVGTGTIGSVHRTIIESLGIGAPNPPGTFLLSINPLFVDIDGPDNTAGTPDDNARLQAGSVAIDRGDNSQTSISISNDIYGDSRFVDDPNTADTGVLAGLPGVIDLGAAEFQPPPFVCVADVNGDGTLNGADFTAWIAAFNANAPECDQNGDGSCTPADFTAWIANFNAGCP